MGLPPTGQFLRSRSSKTIFLVTLPAMGYASLQGVLGYNLQFIAALAKGLLLNLSSFNSFKHVFLQLRIITAMMLNRSRLIQNSPVE